MKKHVGISTATHKRYDMFEYRGEMWRSVNAMMTAYSVDRCTMRNHVKGGETIQEAMDRLLAEGRAIEPSPGQRERWLAFEFRGNYYTSPSACAVAFGRNSGDLSALTRRGFSAEQALERLLAA